MTETKGSRIVMLAGLGSSVIEDRLSSDALKDEGREVVEINCGRIAKTASDR